MNSVAIHKKTKLAVLPYEARIAKLIPHCREVEKNGNQYLLVPAGKEELQLLRNLGYSTPTPLNIDYDWAGNVPFEAQVITADMLIHNPRAYVLSGMGTGKTLAALFAIDYLIKHGLARKALIIAPLSTLQRVWAREVFYRMPHLETSVVHHSVRKKRLEALEHEADIYIINHDGPKHITKELLAKAGIDIVVIDELAVFKNKQTDLWKAVNLIIQNRKFVWGMTGSPTPKEPADAFAQVKLITPANVPMFYKQFKERVMTQVSQWRWLPKPDAKETVFDVMQPNVRFTLDQCTDIPPTTYSTREVPLSKEQKKAYKDLANEYYAEYQGGEITAVNEGVKRMKLLQVAAGFVYDNEQNIVALPCKARVQEAMDIADQCQHKLIIFATFVHVVENLYKEFKAAKFDCEMVYGGTSATKRNEIFTVFQDTDHIDVLIAHPQCMAHGLTLTAADTILWYTPADSLEIYEQANARIPRAGQDKRTHIIHLESTAVERKCYRVLEERGNMQGALLDLFAEETPQTIAS